MGIILRFKENYRKYQHWTPIALFVGGFIFDTLALERVDARATLIQQSAYLLVCGIIISIEFMEYAGVFSVYGRLQKIWHYREHLVHFMLGTLLNSFTIFYFKSASLITSFVFLCLLCALLAVNELRPFKSNPVLLRWWLFSLCLVSFLISFVPILIGKINAFSFVLSLAASWLVFYVFYLCLKKSLGSGSNILGRQIRLPYLIIQLVFAFLYFAKMIPPIPLSASYMGIYHSVQRVGDHYELVSNRPWWKFWQRGDQTFEARSGDKIYCFARVFAPARFDDTLFVRWMLHSSQGWQSTDVVPLEIKGGRDKGFRGFSTKANYQPGHWRVQIETSDGRELGRIYFSVVSNGQPSSDARVEYQ